MHYFLNKQKIIIQIQVNLQKTKDYLIVFYCHDLLARNWFLLLIISFIFYVNQLKSHVYVSNSNYTMKLHFIRVKKNCFLNTVLFTYLLSVTKRSLIKL